MKPKAVIVYVVAPEARQRTELLYYSLELLEKHFNRCYNYPILIFHEDLSESRKTEIQKNFSSNFIFALLDNFRELPSRMEEEQVLRWSQGFDGGRHTNVDHDIGYRHMCRFYSYGIFVHPALQPFDYYWRFDDDSFLLKPVNFDPFAKMQEEGYVYGYRSIMREDPLREEGKGLQQLLDTTKQFARKNKLPRCYLRPFTNWRGQTNGKQYYTNFEITNISFWRNNPLYKQYISTLENQGGFYKYRWGDAAVRSLACGIFLKPLQIHHFGTIAYRHNYHYAIKDKIEIDYDRPDWVNMSSIKEKLGGLPVPKDSEITNYSELN